MSELFENLFTKKECGTGIFMGLDLSHYKLQSWMRELFENFFKNYMAKECGTGIFWARTFLTIS
jgi:hypothetical protein